MSKVYVDELLKASAAGVACRRDGLSRSVLFGPRVGAPLAAFLLMPMSDRNASIR